MGGHALPNLVGNVFFFFLKKKHDLDMPGMDEGFDFMIGGGGGDTT